MAGIFRGAVRAFVSSSARSCLGSMCWELGPTESRSGYISLSGGRVRASRISRKPNRYQQYSAFLASLLPVVRPPSFGLGRGPITPPGPTMVRMDRKDLNSNKKGISTIPEGCLYALTRPIVDTVRWPDSAARFHVRRFFFRLMYFQYFIAESIPVKLHAFVSPYCFGIVRLLRI